MSFEDVQVTAEEETFAAVNNLGEFYYLGKNIPLYLFARPSLNLPLLCSPLPLDKTWEKPTSAGPEVLGQTVSELDKAPQFSFSTTGSTPQHKTESLGKEGSNPTFWSTRKRVSGCKSKAEGHPSSICSGGTLALQGPLFFL